MQEQWNATLWQFFSVVNSWPSHLSRTLTFPQSKRLLPKRLPPALAKPTTLISPTSLLTTLRYGIAPHLTPLGSPISVFAYPLNGWFISPSQLKHAVYYIYVIHLGFDNIDLVTYRYIHIWHMIYIDAACLQGRVFTVDPSFQAFQQILIPLHLQLCLCQNSTLNTTWNWASQTTPRSFL